MERQKLSRAQKRVERHAHELERAKGQPDGRSRQLGEGLEVSAEELQQLQETEGYLAGVAERSGFFKQDGILYQHWVPAIDQIVLPKRCRSLVLQLTHSVPLGGHLRRWWLGSCVGSTGQPCSEMWWISAKVVNSARRQSTGRCPTLP